MGLSVFLQRVWNILATDVDTFIMGDNILRCRQAKLSCHQPKRVVHSDPDILGGTPVFVGTRVPMKTLLEYLEAGDSRAGVSRPFS